MSKKKKIIILVSMVVLLVATAYLNITLANNQGKGGETVTAANFFNQYRNEREVTREEELIILNSIIENAASDKDQIKTATERKLEIVKNMEYELALETAIKGKGYLDCAVTINSNTDNIYVIIKSGELEKEQVAGIHDIISETGAKFDNVKIIPLE